MRFEGTIMADFRQPKRSAPRQIDQSRTAVAGHSSPWMAYALAIAAALIELLPAAAAVFLIDRDRGKPYTIRRLGRRRFADQPAG
jgi:hypothetical protein